MNVPYETPLETIYDYLYEELYTEMFGPIPNSRFRPAIFPTLEHFYLQGMFGEWGIYSRFNGLDPWKLGLIAWTDDISLMYEHYPPTLFCPN